MDFLVNASDCGGLLEVIVLIRKVINVAWIIIPIALIGYGLLDLGKAVIAGKEDEMKKAQGTLIKRFIYALLVFFIVPLVTWAMGLGPKEAGSWSACWEAAAPGSNITDNNGGAEG